MDTLTVGKMTFPLPVNTGNAFLTDLDPAIKSLSSYIEAIAASFVLPKYKEALASLQAKGSMSPQLQLKDQNRLIQTSIPYGLSERIVFLKLPAPFMFLERVSSQVIYNVEGQRVLSSNMMATFVLPSMDEVQFGTLNHFLHATTAAITGCLQEGTLDQIIAGSQILDDAGLERISLDTARYGSFDAAMEKGVLMPMSAMSFTIEEKLAFDDSTLEDSPGTLNVDYAITSIIEDSLLFIEQELKP